MSKIPVRVYIVNMTENGHQNNSGMPPPPPPNGNANDAGPAGGRINEVKVAFPTMHNLKNIELWFAQIRSWFELNRLTADNTKFNMVVAHLRQEVAEQVEEIIRNPPVANKFEALRTAIVARFADSERERVQKLIGTLTLGDKKPSTLLQEMRRVNVGNDDTLLKNLWIQRLPVEAQMTVSIAQGDLQQVAQLADTLLETLRFNQTKSYGALVNQVSSSVGGSSSESRLEQKMDELIKVIAAIQTSNRDNQRRSRSKSRGPGPRGRSSSPPANANLCWYHYNYGAKATKCGKNANPPKNCLWMAKNE